MGALICQPGDELFAVANDGVVIRTRVDEGSGNRSRHHGLCR